MKEIIKMRLKKIFKKIGEQSEKHKLLRIPIGIIFILIGIMGGFIPIFQWWIFILLGCVLLFGIKISKYIKKKK